MARRSESSDAATWTSRCTVIIDQTALADIVRDLDVEEDAVAFEHEPARPRLAGDHRHRRIESTASAG